MNKEPLYSDNLIEIDNETITFRSYYFPTRTKKVVKFAEIKEIISKKPTFFNGKYRYWGTGDFRHWFPRDYKRNKRSVIYFLTLRDKRIKIGFTVENNDAVNKLLIDKSKRYYFRFER
ncbi:MAG: hypothetical protein KDC90_15955 [Ignavibacteriae bacterium]|nr:hypothetical protein [Ignavibacteriota bacterium]